MAVIPQGYDQDLFAANANSGHRALGEILEEFKLLHQATRLMFRSFSNETLQFSGINWNKEMSVLSMGFLITGHFIHHMKTIKEKYLPLLIATSRSVKKKWLNKETPFVNYFGGYCFAIFYFHKRILNAQQFVQMRKAGRIGVGSIQPFFGMFGI